MNKNYQGFWITGEGVFSKLESIIASELGNETFPLLAHNSYKKNCFRSKTLVGN